MRKNAIKIYQNLNSKNHQANYLEQREEEDRNKKQNYPYEHQTQSR